MTFACPACREPLAIQGDALLCKCGQRYPRMATGGFDFLQGRELADFVLNPDDSSQRWTLAREMEGIRFRLQSLILPLIDRVFPATRPTVLACGCGNGLSVEIMRESGSIPAAGIDAGQARHIQWRERKHGTFLHAADALALPFPDETFDLVIPSGLVEHIGIHEQHDGRYRAQRLPQCSNLRQQFINELVRVMRPQGLVVLDHPNGSFPIDFWHGDAPGAIRWHFSREDMLPTYEEVASYFRRSHPLLKLRSLSPRKRFRYLAARRRRFGTSLSAAASAGFSMMEVPGLRWLAKSSLNPYLITVASASQEVLASV